MVSVDLVATSNKIGVLDEEKVELIWGWVSHCFLWFGPLVLSSWSETFFHLSPPPPPSLPMSWKEPRK